MRKLAAVCLSAALVCCGLVMGGDESAEMTALQEQMKTAQKQLNEVTKKYTKDADIVALDKTKSEAKKALETAVLEKLKANPEAAPLLAKAEEAKKNLDTFKKAKASEEEMAPAKLEEKTANDELKKYKDVIMADAAIVALLQAKTDAEAGHKAALDAKLAADAEGGICLTTIADLKTKIEEMKKAEKEAKKAAK